MTAELLLSRLEGVRPCGQGKWTARCPAHEDRTPSLSVRETSDGRVLVHCFAGCGAAAVVAAVGLDLKDLFPPHPASPRGYPPERRSVRELAMVPAFEEACFRLLVWASELNRALREGGPVPEELTRLAADDYARVVSALRAFGLLRR